MDHDLYCPSRHWTKWWQVRFEVQDCQCYIINLVRPNERARVVEQLESVGYHQAAKYIREYSESN